MSFIQSISLFILKDRLNYRGLESGGTMKLKDIAAALSVSEAKPSSLVRESRCW
ncbi:phage terminase small subunit-related protein [Paenibacillus pabuli]|uniref:phage terminase small subunit-related protein n=1 Tax=Paenibacillus pabuli TaxID=1472 RepID=UPI003D7EA8F0